jgi:hypothetical protein
MLGLKANGFALINLVLAVVWVLIALAIGREYGRKSRAVQASPAIR